jgi:cyclophilin family peptidyl-prolyl cis-trans isomerase
MKAMPLLLTLATITFSPLAMQAPALASQATILKQVEKAAGHKVVVGSTVNFTTTKGKFSVVLFPKEAPKTVANFEKLVKSKFYDGLTFHRVIPGFVAQGGDPDGTGGGGPGWTIPDELDSTLKHIDGSLAMAKTSAPNSAGSQFYFCLGAQPHLDGSYTVFGQVVSGLDVVSKLTVGDKMIKVQLAK